MAYFALIQFGEIQFCSRVCANQEERGCEFSLYVSSFAILVLMCCETSLYGDDRYPLAIYNCLGDPRAEYPTTKLCSCEVSDEANMRAFEIYEKERQFVWIQYRDNKDVRGE